MLAKVLHVVQRAAPLSKEGPEFTDSIICVITTIDTIGSIPVRGTADNAFSSLPPQLRRRRFHAGSWSTRGLFSKKCALNQRNLRFLSSTRCHAELIGYLAQGQAWQ